MSADATQRDANEPDKLKMPEDSVAGDENEGSGGVAASGSSNIDTIIGRLVVEQGLATPDDLQKAVEAKRTAIAEGNYPGDMTTSANWPGIAPGVLGMNNALSPKYLNQGKFADIRPKPPVLWIRGADDQIVSDRSMFDLGVLGELGVVPGWPGADVFPAQPMVGQTRAVLERYAAGGGQYRELVFEDCGHGPHIEKHDEFMAALAEFWT